MPAATGLYAEVPSRVDEHVKEMDRAGLSPKVLSGEVAGTSEETAWLFGSGRTLAEDRTGPHPEE